MEIFCLIYFFLFWRSRARSRYSFLNNVYPDLELCDGDWQHKVRVFVQIDAISFQMQNPILTLKSEEKITCIYDSFLDVGESRVWFASKNLTPCRMH